jgi:hypothetical protein
VVVSLVTQAGMQQLLQLVLLRQSSHAAGLYQSAAAVLHALLPMLLAQWLCWHHARLLLLFRPSTHAGLASCGLQVAMLQRQPLMMLPLKE